jgi:hypothetical protein
MAKEDVERFVGLLVSDDDFIKALKRNFDRAIIDRNLALDNRERIILKESFEIYIRPETETPMVTGGTSPVGTLVAEVASSVATAMGRTIVGKTMKGSILTPINQRIRDSIIHRGLLTEADFEGVRDIKQPPVLRPFKKER